MMLLAKVALGFTGTMVLAGVYTFHDGVLRVDVDTTEGESHHVHVWAPAAIVPMAMHVVPNQHLEHAASQVEPYLSTIRAMTKELRKYPEAEFVNVRDSNGHVVVGMHNGKVVVDVDQPDAQVHVACPVAMIEDTISELASRAPGI
jgi:hypothetical protein